MAPRNLASSWLALAALCCSAGTAPPAPPERLPATSAPPEPEVSVQPAKPEQAPEAPAVTHVAVLDPAVLARLSQQGFGLSEVVLGQNAATTLELDRDTPFRDIFKVLRSELERAKRVFPLARPTSIDGFRLFDARWLASSEMSFELSGVFNRLDRRAFYEGTCGEVRLLYRLRYTTEQGGAPMSSRLPMTVNAVYLVADDGASCQNVAREWQSPDALSGDALPRWLVAGPLGREARQRWSLKAVETNLQTIRLQSTVQTTVAGHIEYSLRVFHLQTGDRPAFVAAPMENMPDVARLRADARLKTELLDWLKTPATLAALDQGTLELPERFLATAATSVSPRALTRIANRPFARLFSERDFAALELDGYRSIGSPKALLRRLDGASCTGCHQSHSIAGFHHVGDDPADSPAFSSLFRGSSSHLGADLARREAYVKSVAAGETPDEFRPLPERQGVGRGHGAPCGLGDPGFADWTCDDGYRCVALEDRDVGTCLADHGLGAPCQYGEILPNERPERDHVGKMHGEVCSESLSCDLNISGFPLGSCRGSCKTPLPNGTCGDFLDVDGYQNCLRAGSTNADCVARFVFPTQLRACDAEHACRQDYVCVRTKKAGAGACVPPYFVYPLRNDGYPLKR
ncbi:MAG TPA: hypothetical protein VM686_31990 [Polyangiaceae bacterium]|nr:hypothetical protein [Polyangiaceae bacterium]